MLAGGGKLFKKKKKATPLSTPKKGKKKKGANWLKRVRPQFKLCCQSKKNRTRGEGGGLWREELTVVRLGR